VSKPLWHVVKTRPKAESYATPRALYAALDREFAFTLDPCPLGHEGGLWGTSDGLERSWAGERVYCNPPYGKEIPDWLAKHAEAELAVYLLPAKVDTRWWHRYAPSATEIRFLRGRLKFNDGPHPAPFPSVVLVFSAPGVLPTCIYHAAEEPRDAV
jgi:hypothetical protein